MTRTIGEIAAFLDSRAPRATAEEWDNVGLLLGDPKARTAGAAISVDLTEQALDAAIRRKFKLIVNHHPCIFPKGRGPSRILAESLVHRAISGGVSVYSTHTNFDQCALEVVNDVSKALGALARGRLHDAKRDPLVKLSVYVPSENAEAVREAICAAGAGRIGDYDQCAFATEGTGTFRGGPRTNPALGRPGNLERAREVRLETILPRGLQAPVLRALREAHPYEEVAYDLFPVLQKPTAQGIVSGLGYGFWGDFDEPLPFATVAKRVKKVFRIDRFWLSDPVGSRRKIRRIGFVAGKGASFIGSAAEAGCDLFITGEAGYHDAFAGARQGMSVMEIGHRESERFFLSTLRGWLATQGLKSVILDVPTQKIL